MGDDSDDSDIFVIKQIKPVSRITFQEALLIKHRVLRSARINKKKKSDDKNNVSERKLNKKQKKLVNKEKKSSGKFTKNLDEISSSSVINNDGKKAETIRRNSSEEVKQSPCKKQNVEKSSPIKITDYFIGSASKEPEKNNDSFENVELSPGISRRKKRFKINDWSPASSESRSPVKKSLANVFKEVKEEPETELMENFEKFSFRIEFGSFHNTELEKTFNNVLNTVETLDINSFENNTQLLSFLLKKIIQTELEKQNSLESLFSKNGIKPEKLLLEHEEKILLKFLYLNSNSSNVLVRMLCRKKNWHRVSTLVLKGINNCTKEFVTLHQENFLDVNIGNQDIKTQMNLLLKSELVLLCRACNVFSKSFTCKKKKDLIDALLESSSKQKSVHDFFSKKNCDSRFELLKTQLKARLGLCVKLSETTLSAFNKIVLLFSFAHYSDDESKRLSNQLFMCLKVFKKMMKFPKYELTPCVVFETRMDFEEYEKALRLQNSFEIAVEKKNFDEFSVIADKAEVEFRRLLNDEEYKERFLRLKSFLKKFSGGTIYARILTEYCNIFKKQTDSEKIISVAELLLGQNIFLSRKRGEWYRILSKALENQRKINAAANLVIKSLNDSLLNDVQKLTLQLRGQMILKKKSNGLNDDELREALDSACTLEVREPPSIEIRGQAIERNEKGYKCVYVEQRGNGKMYCSVEEKAISYYKSNGFSRGFHVEGFIVFSMYFLFFYDIIYDLSPEGVFHSPYQEAPLDFYSSCFYKNRKVDIELLFEEMLCWNDEEIETKLNEVYSKNLDTTCLITWKEGFTPDLFCEFLKCLTMPMFVSICRRLITSFGSVRSGFPDLTLWNPDTKKCKFVEVKSPTDKLSPAQRLWLDYLRNIGIDCEVCNVKNVSGKKFKSC